MCMTEAPRVCSKLVSIIKPAPPPPLYSSDQVQLGLNEPHGTTLALTIISCKLWQIKSWLLLIEDCHA